MDSSILTGSLVRLRAIEVRDLDSIAVWRSDPKSYDSFFEFGPLPMAGQEEWYRRHCFNDREKNFIIEPLTGGEPSGIGIISVVNIDWRSRNAELGRLLIGERKYRGLEYAPEAIVLACEYAFDHLNLHKIYCEVLASQTRVISMHRKLGAVDEGVRREHVFKRGRYEDVVILALFQKEYVRRDRHVAVRSLAARRAVVLPKSSSAAIPGESVT